MSTDSTNRNAFTQAPYPVQLVAIPVATVFGLLLYAVLSAPGFINYDCAFYLLGSKLLLDGRQQLVDLLPPIIFYFAVPPWWISKLTSLPITLVWQLFVLGAVYLSGFATVAILQKARLSGSVSLEEQGALARRDLFSVGPLVTAFFLFQLTLGFHFGQREHFFVLAYFPLFLLRWLRWHNRYPSSKNLVATVLGVTCGAITYVKPQFLLVLILIELTLFVSTRHQKQWRNCVLAAEQIALIVTLLLCFLASFAIPNIGEYYTRWIPFLTSGYAAYNAPSLADILSFTSPDGHLLANPVIAIVILTGAMCFWKRSSLIPPLIAWVIGGLLVFLIQGRGWSYQSIPCVSGFFLVSSVVIYSVVEFTLSFVASKINTARSLSSNARQFAVISFLLWSCILMPLTPFLVKNSMVTGKTFDTLDRLVEVETKSGDSIVILHTMLPHAHQLQLKKDLTPATRYVWCFPLRMTSFLLRENDNREMVKRQEQTVVTEIVDDVQTGKPRLVIIEAWVTQPGGWTLARALEEHRFNQRALIGYEPMGMVDGCAVWKRRSQQ
ncbi:hypothetical protein KF707_09375 [Candidatus Obscuribacterales bacterium]|nr:hypothetical protein [Candidatus Obscuribacterales bacterium]